MRGARFFVIAAALAAPSGCALVGFDLGDYGGGGDVGADGSDSSDVTVHDGPGPDGQEGSVGNDAEGGVITDAPVDDVITIDGGRDADAGKDALVDTGIDAPIDTGIDAGKDAGTDSALPPCTPGATSKRIFVSSATYTLAGVGSLTNADMNCGTLAANAGVFEPNFRAWLSDETTSAGSRITHDPTNTYYTMDGTTLVACNWAELTSTPHRHAIDRDENKTIIPTSPGCGGNVDRAVWTGTNPDGTIASGKTCTSWTSAAGGALMGLARGIDATWTSGCSGALCGGSAAIYCVEQ